MAINCHQNYLTVFYKPFWLFEITKDNTRIIKAFYIRIIAMQKTKMLPSEDDFDNLLLAEEENILQTAQKPNYNLSFDPLEDFNAHFVSIFQNPVNKKDLLQ